MVTMVDLTASHATDQLLNIQHNDIDLKDMFVAG